MKNVFSYFLDTYYFNSFTCVLTNSVNLSVTNNNIAIFLIFSSPQFISIRIVKNVTNMRYNSFKFAFKI